MKKLILLALLAISGCTTLNNTINCGAGDAKQTVRSDQDQTPTANTTTSLPVSVGAQPTSTGSIK